MHEKEVEDTLGLEYELGALYAQREELQTRIDDLTEELEASRKLLYVLLGKLTQTP